MITKRKVIALAILTLSLTLVSGSVLASGYTRYVLPGPNGSTLFVFTNGCKGLDLIMRDIFKFGIPVIPVIPNPKPTPKPEPTPDPVPVPDPKPDPTPAPEPTPEPKPAPDPEPTPGLTAMEQGMVDLVNQERAKLGLKPLAVDMRLVELARKKSQDMIDKGYFSHTSPTYGSPFDMMNKAGITYHIAGENLAGAPTLEMAHKGLMESDGHRRNILNTQYDHIGIGVVKGGPYGYMFTQMFTGQ